MPLAMASSGGRPKPSYSDGNTKTLREAIEHGQRLGCDEAEESDVLVQLVPVDGPSQPLEYLEIWSPMITSFSCVKALPAYLVEGLDEALEVLVRLDVADVQDERVGQLIPLARALDIDLGRGSTRKRSSMAL